MADQIGDARVQHAFNFSGASTWTVSYDALLSNHGTKEDQTSAGSFSLQNATTYGLVALLGWMNDAADAEWAAVYSVANPGGTMQQKNAWTTLLQDHWCRQTTLFDINTKQILSASLTDLTGSTTFATIIPTDWYFIGGPTSTFTPDAIRLFANGSETVSNTVAWDNVSLAGDSSVPEPATVVMAGAALAALALWRRR